MINLFLLLLVIGNFLPVCSQVSAGIRMDVAIRQRLEQELEGDLSLGKQGNSSGLFRDVYGTIKRGEAWSQPLPQPGVIAYRNVIQLLLAEDTQSYVELNGTNRRFLLVNQSIGISCRFGNFKHDVLKLHTSIDWCDYLVCCFIGSRVSQKMTNQSVGLELTLEDEKIALRVVRDSGLSQWQHPRDLMSVTASAASLAPVVPSSHLSTRECLWLPQQYDPVLGVQQITGIRLPVKPICFLVPPRVRINHRVEQLVGMYRRSKNVDKNLLDELTKVCDFLQRPPNEELLNNLLIHSIITYDKEAEMTVVPGEVTLEEVLERHILVLEALLSSRGKAFLLNDGHHIELQCGDMSVVFDNAERKVGQRPCPSVYKVVICARQTKDLEGIEKRDITDIRIEYDRNNNACYGGPIRRLKVILLPEKDDDQG